MDARNSRLVTARRPVERRGAAPRWMLPVWAFITAIFVLQGQSVLTAQSDAVIIRTNDGGGTERVRLKVTTSVASPGTADIEVQNGRIKFSTTSDGFLNIASDAAGTPQAGDIRYNAGNVFYYNGSTWVPIEVAGGGGWTDDGAVVRLTTAGDSVGIGTTTCDEKLDLEGHAIFGINQVAWQGSDPAILRLNEETSDNTVALTGVESVIEMNFGTDSAKVYSALYGNANTEGTANFTGRLVGVQGQVDHYSTGTLTQSRPLGGFTVNRAGGTITTAYGGLFGIVNQGAGTITDGYCIFVRQDTNNGTFTNKVGLAVDQMTNATNTTNLLLGTSAIPSGAFSMYSASSSDSYYAGDIGVGTTNPTARVDVKGTTNFGISYQRTDAKDARIQVGDNTQSWSIASGWATAGDFSLIEEGVSGNRIYVQQGSGAIALNSSNPFKRLSVNAGGTANDGIGIEGTSNPGLNFRENGTDCGALGVASSADGWVTGSTRGDLVLRVDQTIANQDIHFTTNGGTSRALTIEVDGDLDMAVDSARLRLPRKATTGDPAGALEGMIYYNDADNEFRIYDGGWKTLDTSGSGDCGWIDGGTDVYLATSTDLVGIGTSTPAYPLDVNGQAQFRDDIFGSEGFSVDNDATDAYDDATSNSPYSRVNADSFHTNGLGVGQMYIEGRAIDSNSNIMIGAGLAGGQSPQNILIGTDTANTTNPPKLMIADTATDAASLDGNAEFMIKRDNHVGMALVGGDTNRYAFLHFGKLSGAAQYTLQYLSGVGNEFLELGKGGSIGIRVNASNEVGIGRDPSGKLDVDSTATTEGYWLDGKAAMTGESANQWLRINQNSSWTNGTFTPLLMRADGGYQVDGNQIISADGFELDLIRGDSSKIHSVGTISFDWTAGTYDSPDNHGITSKNEAGTLGDELRINSYNDVIMTIDSNNNDATSYFKVQHHSTGNGTDLFWVRSDDGNAYHSGQVGIGTTTTNASLDIQGGGINCGPTDFGFYPAAGEIYTRYADDANSGTFAYAVNAVNDDNSNFNAALRGVYGGTSTTAWAVGAYGGVGYAVYTDSARSRFGGKVYVEDGIIGENHIIRPIGTIGHMVFNKYDLANTSFWFRSTPTIAGNSPYNDLMSINNDGNVTHYKPGGGWYYEYVISQHVAYYKVSGGYNWYWRTSDSGVQGGANERERMRLDFNGNLATDGNMNANAWDVAENIYALNRAEVEPGDLLSAGVSDRPDAPVDKVAAEKSSRPYDRALIGIVSTRPGVVMGTGGLNGDYDVSRHELLALNGRVPSKVASITGDIGVGDPITSSALPGIGMKAVRGGSIVGKALETLDTSKAVDVDSLADISWPEDDGLNPLTPCFRVPVSSLSPYVQDALARDHGLGSDDFLFVGKVMTLINVSWHDPGAESAQDLPGRVQKLERENKSLRKKLDSLRKELEEIRNLVAK